MSIEKGYPLKSMTVSVTLIISVVNYRFDVKGIKTIVNDM